MLYAKMVGAMADLVFVFATSSHHYLHYFNLKTSTGVMTQIICCLPKPLPEKSTRSFEENVQRRLPLPYPVSHRRRKDNTIRFRLVVKLSVGLAPVTVFNELPN